MFFERVQSEKKLSFKVIKLKLNLLIKYTIYKSSVVKCKSLGPHEISSLEERALVYLKLFEIRHINIDCIKGQLPYSCSKLIILNKKFVNSINLLIRERELICTRSLCSRLRKSEHLNTWANGFTGCPLASFYRNTLVMSLAFDFVLNMSCDSVPRELNRYNFW